MPVLGKSVMEITSFSFSSRFDNVFVSRFFFQKKILGKFSTFLEGFFELPCVVYHFKIYYGKNI